jgi:hypothetical protein
MPEAAQTNSGRETMGGLSKTSSGFFFFNRMALFGGEIVEATFCT